MFFDGDEFVCDYVFVDVFLGVLYVGGFVFLYICIGLSFLKKVKLRCFLWDFNWGLFLVLIYY